MTSGGTIDKKIFTNRLAFQILDGCTISLKSVLGNQTDDGSTGQPNQKVRGTVY
jgi:hypothetical protein